MVFAEAGGLLETRWWQQAGQGQTQMWKDDVIIFSRESFHLNDHDITIKINNVDNNDDDNKNRLNTDKFKYEIEYKRGNVWESNGWSK